MTSRVDDKPLTGLVAVVTGGSSGIGVITARTLGQSGAKVVIAGRRREMLDEAMRQLAEAGIVVEACPCDVAKPEDIVRLESTTRELYGPAHILINNAGVSSSAPLLRLELAEWNRLMNINATGPFLCTKAFLPGMLDHSFGRVVTIASTAALYGAPYIAAYTASKHAALGFVRAAAAELASKGVTVNAVCPGYVDTPMTERTIELVVQKTGRTRKEALAAILKEARQERLIRPEEVAQTVVDFCLSPNRTGNALELS